MVDGLRIAGSFNVRASRCFHVIRGGSLVRINARHADDATLVVLERTISGGWFRGTCRGTRSSAIDTGPFVGCIFREGGRGRGRLFAQVMRRSDRGTIVRIELRSLRSRMLHSCLGLHCISIFAIDRTCLWTRLARASDPTVHLHGNFNRTLADAVESAATICTRMMHRETPPRRRCRDVKGLID